MGRRILLVLFVVLPLAGAIAILFLPFNASDRMEDKFATGDLQTAFELECSAPAFWIFGTPSLKGPTFEGRITVVHDPVPECKDTARSRAGIAGALLLASGFAAALAVTNWDRGRPTAASKESAGIRAE